MLFSINFKSSKKETADEIRCPYNQLGRIYDFIKNHPDKRYCIETRIQTQAQDEVEVDIKKLTDQIEYVKAIATDYTVSCGNVGLLQSLIKANYHAFLRFPVADWETFSALQNMGVTDIYIDGPLGFQCTQIEQGKQTTKIRVSPTISANACFNLTPSSFFIRPEDLHLYSSSIDVIDFKEPNQEKEDTLFDIYKRGSFYFTINKLIKGLPSDVNNTFIRSDFAQQRLNCGQRCKIPKKTCHLCETQFTLSHNITTLLRQKDLFENKK